MKKEKLSSQEKTARPSAYPKFDTHVHPVGPKAHLLSMMDALGVETVLNLSYSGFRSSDDLLAFEDALRVDVRMYPARFRFASAFSVTDFREPGYTERVVKKLQHDIDEHGAVAVKIWKDLGMMLRDPDGRYVFCDDIRFQPIYDFIASKGLVIYAHIADPLAGWQPLDTPSPHAGYFRAHPEFHWYGKPGKPSHDEILDHRDALIARYPNTVFVAAHLASLEHDLDRVAKFLDAFPNARVDTAARFSDLMLMPNEQVRDFFIRYQDRILYGTDWEYDAAAFTEDTVENTRYKSACTEKYRRAFAYFEETLALPAEVLHKFYFSNAIALFSSAAREGSEAV